MGNTAAPSPPPTEQRVTGDDEFAFRFDYVMVFAMKDVRANKDGLVAAASACPCSTTPAPVKKLSEYIQTPECKAIIALLQDKGVHIFTYLSIQSDELYCLLRVNNNRLCRFAAKANFQMQIDEAALKSFLYDRDPEPGDDATYYRASPVVRYRLEAGLRKLDTFIDDGMSFHVNFSMPVNGRICRNDKS